MMIYRYENWMRCIVAYKVVYRNAIYWGIKVDDLCWVIGKYDQCCFKKVSLNSWLIFENYTPPSAFVINLPPLKIYYK